MNIYAHYLDRIITILSDLQQVGTLPEDLVYSHITLEPPRDAAHGDLSTNAAMVLSKQVKMPPRALATLLVNKLVEDKTIIQVDIAGPGFINFQLTPQVWKDSILHIVQQGPEYGRNFQNIPENINIEFVSANPTGPLHVGHTRGAVFGDALANLLEFTGHNVTREYYINDAGTQVDVLARSVYLRYQEVFGQQIDIPEGLYPGDYLKEVAQKLKDMHGDAFLNQPESDWLEPVRAFAIEEMMTIIKNDLSDINIHMDKFFSEQTLQQAGTVQQTVDVLKDKGLVYTGILPAPKGKLLEDWEEREQTLFRSTAYGDDVDRPLQKSDGSWTYFAPDVAYHKDKINRGYTSLINIFGADHGGYVKRMTAAVHALSDNKINFDIKLCQLVRLFKNGIPYKMSKRAGTFVTLRDIIDEVGPDVTRFVMLTRKNDATLDFDFSKALEQSKDNPVFYVQYAHARACSVLRSSPQNLPEPDFTCIDTPQDIILVKKLSEWPRIIQQAATAREPHRIAFYLYDLASSFHALWSYGRENINVRFIQEDQLAKTAARLMLVQAVEQVIAHNLRILGVTPLREM